MIVVKVKMITHELFRSLGGVVWRGICAFLAISTVQASIDTEFKEAQQRTQALLSEYLSTGDWQKRVDIMNARGNAEIGASRIYRAFEILCIGKKPKDDAQFVEEARKEVYRNPEITLVVLKPILSEKLNKTYSLRGYWASPDLEQSAHQSTYLQICCDIAKTETNAFAIHYLVEIERNSDSNLRALAKIYLNQAREDNWTIHQRRFLQTKSPASLKWLANHMLYKGERQEDVESILGKGIRQSDPSIEYSAKDENERRVLKLLYWDGELSEWRWE